MNSIQFLMNELKLDREDATLLDSFLQNWKTFHRSSVSSFLERKAWRKRRDVITNPNNISDRILGYELGLADGYDEAVKALDSISDQAAKFRKDYQ